MGWQYSRDESETFLRHDTPLKLEGISWKPHEPEYPNEPFEHHDFGKPIRHTAGTEHETWYHLTDNPKFKLDPEHAPADNAFAIDDRSGRKGIYLAKSPAHWFSAAGEGYARPYVAEFHARPGISEHDAGGRWGGEIFIPPEHHDKLHLHRVIPIDAHIREEYGSHGWIEEHHGTEFDTGKPIQAPGWNAPVSAHYQHRGYHYPGPDVREMTPEQHGQHRERWLDYMRGDRGWDDEGIEELRQAHGSVNGVNGMFPGKHARVPWTPHEREQLHKWQEHPTASYGDFVPSHEFTNKYPEPVPEPDPETEFAEMVGPRAFTEMTARLAAHDVHDPKADEVYGLLAKKFPPKSIAWVHDAKWSGPERVPLDQIDTSNRDTWSASSNPKKVKKFKKKILKKEDKGKDPKPAILVARPGKDTQMIADGHHRFLAEEALAQDDDSREGLHAWTAHVDDAEGPWTQMHSSQETGPGDALDEPGDQPEPPLEGTEDELAPGPGDTGQVSPEPGGEDTAQFEPDDSPPGQPMMPPAVVTGLPPMSQSGTPGPRTRNMTPVEQSPSLQLAHPELQQQQEPGDADDADDTDDTDDGDTDEALDALEKSAGNASFRFEFTSAWRDVVAKAERIVRENGVRITALAGSLTVGEVKGDHATYEAGLQYYPGRGWSVMAYSCGCPWASFHQDPDYPSRFAGRMCSHAYALGLAARQRGQVRKTMFPDTSGWPEEVVTKSWPPWHPSDKAWAQEWRAPMTTRPVLSSLIPDGSLDQQVISVPAVTAARVLVDAGEDPGAVTTLLRLAGFQGIAVSHPVSWDEIGERHPGLYGDPEVHGEAAEGADGEGVGWAANILANDRPEDPDGQNSGSWDLHFHREKVDPRHIDYARHGMGDSRVRYAREGYALHPEQVPPAILVHRHGVYQVADGHHRAEGAAEAHRKVDAYVAYSEHEDVPFSRDEDGEERKGPFHGAIPHPGVAAHRDYFRKEADQANAPWGSQDVADMPPQKPYGATDLPDKDMDPGSYGFLAGPDPDNWGQIQDNSAITAPLTNEAAKDDSTILDQPDTGDWADEGQTFAYQEHEGARIFDNSAGRSGRGVSRASRQGMARQGTGPVPDTAMDTNTGPVTQEWGEGFPYTDVSPSAGPATAVSPHDPAGIRMEEVLAPHSARETTTLDRPQLMTRHQPAVMLHRPGTMTSFEQDLSHGGGGFPPIGGGMEGGGGGGGDNGDPQHFLVIRNAPGHFGLVNNVSEDHAERHTSYHHSVPEAIHFLGHLERGGHYQPHELSYLPNAQGTRMHDIGDQYISHVDRWFNEGHPDYNPHPDTAPAPQAEAELDQHWRSYHSATPMKIKGMPSDAKRLQLKQTMHDLHHGKTRMAPEFHLCPNKLNRWDRTPGAERCEFESTGHTHMPAGLEDLFSHGEGEFMAGEGQGPTKYSALRQDAVWATEQRDAMDPEFRSRGHDMNWERGHGWNRKGQAQYWEGTCNHCGAGATVGSSWSSSHSGKDARHETCSGPGTAWQNEMVEELRHERVQQAVSEFGRAVKQNYQDADDREWLRGQGIEASLGEPQPDGALAELKDEPEGALDPEGLTADSEENPQNPWGNPRQATYEDARAYNLARTLPRYPDTSSTTDAGRAQHPDQFTTQEPGMGSMDEPYAPSDSSVQTIGQQQWSGADYNSADLATAYKPDEHEVEPEGMEDIVAAFQRSAAALQYSGDGAARADTDIAGAARAYLAKEADCLPADEADELIREGRGTRARNLDLLDLKGTHYTDEPGLDDHDDDVLYA